MPILLWLLGIPLPLILLIILLRWSRKTNGPLIGAIFSSVIFLRSRSAFSPGDYLKHYAERWLPGTVGQQSSCRTVMFLSFRPTLWETIMSILKWALIFFIISVVAAVFGFTGISAASADVARVLFYVFLVIFVLLLLLGLTIFRA